MNIKRLLQLTAIIAISLNINCYGINSPDQYIQNFVNRCNSPRVEYKNDSLILSAEPSMLRIALKAFGTYICACGLAYLIAHATTAPRNEPIALLLPFALPLACLTIWLGSKTYDEHLLQNTNRPYIILNEKGLNLCGKAHIDWQMIDHIEMSSTIVTDQYGIQINRTRTADFVDQYLNVLFAITDKDGYLPISFDNFIALSKHYLEKARP